ncbi:MAG: hypothetical protein LUG51_01365 [Tannerellaceae bacterium]|nr:hypothetical protein [Tannerellaceae bacterium]
MKQSTYTYLLFILLGMITACDTHREYDIEYTPIAPLGGQYRIYVYNQQGEELLKDYCYIANTSGYDPDQCWIRIGEYNENPENPWAINGKITCEISTLTFSGNEIENLAGNVTSSPETFTLMNGRLLLNEATTPSGATADSIHFSFHNSRFPGELFTAQGYRYKGWNGD